LITGYPEFAAAQWGIILSRNQTGGTGGSPEQAVVKPVFCHPERRPGSQLLENTRFFAAPRMTLQVGEAFSNRLPDDLEID
jgi:hypothetical protein